MAGRWNATFAPTTQNVGTGAKTQLSMYQPASALRRGELVEFSFGQADVPNATDCPVTWQIQRSTADGTGTAFTAMASDPADSVAASILSKHSYSAEPTLTAAAFLFSLSVNQRGAWRWVATPGGELIVPVTNNNGLSLLAKSPNYASTTSIHMGWQE